MKALCRLLLTALLPLCSYAQADSVAVQQPAEDFVTASVCVASPGDAIYSALGHACLRLQCPVYDLDYVYSYESEDARHKVLDFFAGRLKMAVRAVPTEQYVALYAPEGRGVREYELNLPIRVKQRLWKQMDERLDHSPVPYDYMNRGCAVSVLRWIEEAVGKDSLQYGPWPEKYERSRKEIGGDSIANEWTHAFLYTFIAGEASVPDYEMTGKVIVPTELIEVMQSAKAFGEPLLTGKSNVLLRQTSTVGKSRITPLMVSLVFLFLALLNLRLHNTLLRCIALAPCLLLGAFVLYLVALSNLTCTEWNWLIIPFCPLPFLFWKWRKWWAPVFAGVCFVWIVAMLFYQHHIVDGAHLVLAATMGLCNIEIKNQSINLK